MSLINQIQAVTYTLEGPGMQVVKGREVSSIEKLISTVIGVMSVVAFIYFALQIIFAGYEFLNSQGDAKKIESARKRITDGILGIFIIIVAVAITSLIATIAGIPNVLDLNNFFNTVAPSSSSGPPVYTY